MGGGADDGDSGGAPPHRRLYHFDQVPLHLQDNPYIFTGYRAFLTYRQCLLTICGIHNELINVWTHLLGFLWAFAAFVWNNAVLFGSERLASLPSSPEGHPPDTSRHAADRFVLNTYLICVQGCLLASAAFHLFLPHISEKAHARWFQLDLLGITFGMLGCYVPGVHFGFYCDPNERWLYTVVCGIMFVINILMQLHRDFLSHRWAIKRVLLFSCTLGFGGSMCQRGSATLVFQFWGRVRCNHSKKRFSGDFGTRRLTLTQIAALTSTISLSTVGGCSSSSQTQAFKPPFGGQSSSALPPFLCLVDTGGPRSTRKWGTLEPEREGSAARSGSVCITENGSRDQK